MGEGLEGWESSPTQQMMDLAVRPLSWKVNLAYNLAVDLPHLGISPILKLFAPGSPKKNAPKMVLQRPPSISKRTLEKRHGKTTKKNNKQLISLPLPLERKRNDKPVLLPRKKVYCSES